MPSISKAKQHKASLWKAMWHSQGEKITLNKIMPQTNIKRKAICGLHTKFLTMLILCKFSLRGTSVASRAAFKLIFRRTIFHAVGSTLMRRSSHKCTNCVRSLRRHKMANVKRIYLSLPL